MKVSKHCRVSHSRLHVHDCVVPPNVSPAVPRNFQPNMEICELLNYSRRAGDCRNFHVATDKTTQFPFSIDTLRSCLDIRLALKFCE